MKELKLARFQPSSETSCARWSADGILAIACGSEILLPCPVMSMSLAPDNKLPRCTYESTTTAPWASFPHPLSTLKREPDEQFSVSSSIAEKVATYTDVAWSPSSPHGCTLAALTDTGEVFLFTAVGNNAKNKWTVTACLTTVIVNHWNTDEPELSHHREQQLTAHSIAWSAPVSQDSHNTTSLFALGNAYGSVYLFLYKHAQLVCLGEHQVGPGSGSGSGSAAVTHLEWSPVSSSMCITLSAATSSNAVFIATFKWNGSSLDVVAPFSELVAPNMFYLSSTAWLLGSDSGSQSNILALRYTDQLIVASISPSGSCIATKSIPTTYWEATAGMTVSSNSAPTGYIDITCLSTLGAVQGLRIKCDTLDYTGSPVGQGLASRLAKKIKSYSDKLELAAGAECSALLLHPHGSYLAVIYSLHAANQPRYPLSSSHVCRVLFFVPPVAPIHPPSILQESSLSMWCQVSAMLSYTPGQSLEKIIESVQPLAEPTPCPSSLPTANYLEGSLCTSQMDQDRFYNHLNTVYGTPNAESPLKVISTIANYILGHHATAQSNVDRALLLCYSNFSSVPHTDETPTIALKGGFFEESFDFSLPCQDTLSIQSLAGHVWRRCSLTLLPLMTPDLMTCSGCDRKRLVRAPSSSDSLVDLVLTSIPKCPYCGCHYQLRAL